MEITITLSSNTVEMLKLLAQEGDRTISSLIQELALDRYMQRALDMSQIGVLHLEPDLHVRQG